MNIACLGWGSLIWRPDNLLIRREWFSDGPFLPVEFVRQSNDRRLTLVLSATAKPVRTLWALMATDNLNVAKESLRDREGVPKSQLNISIASILKHEESNEPIKQGIQIWLKENNLDAAIWTDLPARFNGENNRVPTLAEAIEYLKALDINVKSIAEEYIRRAPKQIYTDYRRMFEAVLGWTSTDS